MKIKSIIKKYKIKNEIIKLYKNIKKMEEYEDEMKIIGHGDPISFIKLEQLKKNRKIQLVK